MKLDHIPNWEVMRDPQALCCSALFWIQSNNHSNRKENCSLLCL